MKELVNVIKDFLNFKLISIKENPVTLWNILLSLILIIVLVIIVNQLTRLIEKKVLERRLLNIGAAHAVSTIMKYVFITIGTIVILSSSGINLSALTVLVGTLGVGIGFGLQSITSNFISGLIILIEQPIKVGDRIEVGDTSGDVLKIAIRATTILTNDNIAIIVPNTDFITKEVINWSYLDRKVRFKIPVGVSYSSDVYLVKKLLMEVANNHEDVLKDPQPMVRLSKFGKSSINFELCIWTSALIDRKGRLTSEINFGIFDKFKENDIKIPHTQLDVHITKKD
jgi:small-conductance mechanosensitive channel